MADCNLSFLHRLISTFIKFLGVKSQAFPILSTTSPSLPLNSLHLRNRHSHQRVHICFGIECLLFHIPAINHKTNVANSEGCLCNVGAVDHFSNSFRSLLKNSSLIFIAQSSVKLIHDHAGNFPTFQHKFLQFLLAESSSRLALL